MGRLAYSLVHSPEWSRMCRRPHRVKGHESGPSAPRRGRVFGERQSSVSSCSTRALRRRGGASGPAPVGCSTIAITRAAMKRPTRTECPVRVSSATSTMPRALLTSTRRPARVAEISKVRVPPVPVSITTSTMSPITRATLATAIGVLSSSPVNERRRDRGQLLMTAYDAGVVTAGSR
jgi:hypothetical protein